MFTESTSASWNTKSFPRYFSTSSIPEMNGSSNLLRPTIVFVVSILDFLPILYVINAIGRQFSEDKKGKDLVRQELARVRATAMEGSFGTQKEHYDLRRVKARTKLTEILYIFFGIHTANVVQLADRIEQRAQLAAS